MAVTPRLDLRQVQGLVMTPQLQQAIKLLQLNNLELAEYVEEELERNPLLERSEGDDGDAPAAEAAPSEGDGDGDGDGAPGLEAVDTATTADDAHAGSDAMDVDVDDRWDGDAPAQPPTGEAQTPDMGGGMGESFSGSTRGGSFDDGEFGLEQTLSSEISLRDHLSEQLSVDITDASERLIGRHLIEMLDDAGYLSGSIEDAAAMLGCAPDAVEVVLEKLQGFDPPGIFARDLAECLAIQLKDRDRLDPAMEAFLQNLDLLAKRDMAGLQKACNVDAEDIADMAGEIRALNPRPASAFEHDTAHAITPDVLMRPHPDGGWMVELNTEMLPRVLLNNAYYARIRADAKTEDDKRYISECYQSASWLVKSLHQRATTILKVAGEIVRQQDAFFMHGVHHLRPLVLRDIADVIEMHESTVSRVTSNKYIATPRGIFELKYFFTTAIASSGGGESHSSESVRHRIKALIDAEDPESVLSDDKLVQLLKAEGMDIARRTVAKYRESLGLSSSVQRRREKKASF